MNTVDQIKFPSHIHIVISILSPIFTESMHRIFRKNPQLTASEKTSRLQLSLISRETFREFAVQIQQYSVIEKEILTKG